MQNKNKCFIVYISKDLSLNQQVMLVSERYLLSIVYAINKWNTYLAYKLFFLKTEKENTIFMMEQQLNKPISYKCEWLNSWDVI